MIENIFGSLVPQNNIYNTEETFLQSDSMSGKISGGTKKQRRFARADARALNREQGGGLFGEASDASSNLDLGVSSAESFIPGAANNPYLNAAKNNPLMKAGLKTMNPFIIGAGLLTTAAMGSKAKKDAEILKNQTNTNQKNKNVLMEGLQGKKDEMSNFYAGQKKAAGNAYGVGDIDNFLQQNRV